MSESYVGCHEQYFESRIPPSSFNPLNASESDLAFYGFPTRPNDSMGQSSWQKTWNNFKSVTQPSFCKTNRYNLSLQTTSASAGLAATGTFSATTTTTVNWSGIVSYNASGYVAVQGDWPQSHVYNCQCGTTDTDESSWSGIGGAMSQSLLQEGTSMQGAGTMFAWYEYLHACPASNQHCNVPELEISGLTVSGGMSIHTYTAYQTSTHQANFLVCANGYCRSIVMTLDSSYYDGRSAEQIDEKPTYCSSTGCFYKPVTNFLYNNWTNLEAETQSQSWVNEPTLPGWLLAMANSSDQTLVHPTALGTNTMTDTWEQAQ